jgi:sugar lactone lactonase YvrE
VTRFDPSGRPVGVWSLEDPVALSSDVNAGLWAAAGDEIYRLLPQEPPRRIASQGDFATITAMAVDGEGGVWVVDRRGERVGRIDPGTATPRAVFETDGRRIKSMVWDGRRLLAIDSRGRDLVAYTPDGVSSSLGVAGLLRPSAVAVDAAGRAAILDTKNEQVIFTEGGAPLDYRGAGLQKPTALAFGWDGVLHLYDDASGGWVRFR